MSLRNEISEYNLENCIELVYKGLWDKKITTKDEIDQILLKGEIDVDVFGWRLFESIMAKVENCKSQLYPLSLKILKEFFKLFLKHKNKLKRSYPTMVANMILGKGNTGFTIENREELNLFLSDFKNLGFSCTFFDILKGLFNKRNIKKSLFSKRIFKRIIPFFDFESEINDFILLDFQQPLIIGLLAEKYIDDKSYRFKDKINSHLLQSYIDEAKSSGKSLKERAELFLKALLIAMVFDNKTIEYCFSNYFFNMAWFHYNQKNTNIALICYDYARKFFELIENENFKLSTEAYYFNCLSKYYAKEQRFDSQESALQNELISLRKLLYYGVKKFEGRFYYILTKYLYIKAKNFLFNNNYQACREIVENFFRKKDKFPPNFTSDFIEDISFKLQALKYEALGKKNFQLKNYTLALENIEKARILYEKLPLVYSSKDYFYINQLEKFIQARKEDDLGDFVKAFQIMEEIINNYKNRKHIRSEFLNFWYLLRAKINLMDGKIESSLDELSFIINNKRTLEFYDEIYEISKELYNLLSSVMNYEYSFKEFDRYIIPISDESQYSDFWNEKIMNREYNLPIMGINCKYINLKLDDNYFFHIIRNYERRKRITLPKDKRKYYPIFELIVLEGLLNHQEIIELIKNMHEEGQKNPIIISNNGQIIDGNKRLTAMKLSKYMVNENKIIKPLPFDKVKIVKIPEDLTDSEILEIRARLKFHKVSNIEVKRRIDFIKMLTIVKLLKYGFPEETIKEILVLNDKDNIFYRSLSDLIEGFLEYVNYKDDFYIIKKFEIFNHFIELNKELLKLGVQTGFEGIKLIKLKKKLRDIAFIWLENNIIGELRLHGNIFKEKNLKKLKYLLINPKRYEIVERIIEGDITDKVKIQDILETMVNRINLIDEKRTNLEHAKMIYNKINFLKENLYKYKYNSEEKVETVKFLKKANTDINNLIESIKES